MVSDDPVGRLDFECPDVKAFLASVQDELRTSGLSGRERFDAQMAKMAPFARRHTRACARCRHHGGTAALRSPAKALIFSLTSVAVLAAFLYFLHPSVARAVGAILAVALAAAAWFSARR